MLRTRYSCQGPPQTYIRYQAASEREDDTLLLCRRLVDTLVPMVRAQRAAGEQIDFRVSIDWNSYGSVSAELRIVTIDPWREAAVAAVTRAIAASLDASDDGRAP